MTEKKRIEEIDIIKALGIICMVLGHADFPGTRFVFLFHMAVFFLASGFFFQTEASETFRKGVLPFLRKRLKQLWFPYVVWQAVFTCLNNVFLQLNLYTSNPGLFDYVAGNRLMNVSALAHEMSLSETLAAVGKTALFKGITQLGRPMWFLETLFFVSIAYCLTDYLIKKLIKGSAKRQKIAQGTVSVVLLFAGYACKLFEIEAFGFARAASCYVLFFVGCLLQGFRERLQEWNRKSFLAGAVVSFLILLGAFSLYPGGLSVDLRTNTYQNPVYFLICSLAGWVFLYSIAYFIKQLPFKRVFTEIGKRTLSILIFHYAAFKFVVAVVVASYHLPAFCLAALPHLYGETGVWWLAYGVAGVAVPIGLNFAYRGAVAACNKVLKTNRSGENYA